MKFKIILYNILNGFCNNNTPFKIDNNRMNKFLQIIKNQNPDILILNEAYFWPFAKEINFRYIDKILKNLYNEYTTLAHNYFRWAPIILSKFKVEKFDTSLSKYNFNYLRAELKIQDKSITIDVFHPHLDTNEEQKVGFLKPIIKNMSQNYILSGDLNALSLEDNYDKKKLIGGYQSFMKDKGKDKVTDMLKMLIIKEILNNGLVDTYKAKNKKTDFTVPTDLMSKNKDAAARIDYIFISDNFKIINSGIIKNKITETASDHYPIYATLEI